MASELQDDRRRPYAATANVIAVLERARTRNLPDKITNDFLKIAQIGEAVFGRVMFALQFLGLIRDDGTPSDKLRAMASAPEPEFRELLAATVREAYAPEFASVDPGEDSQAQVTGAFQRYLPKSQIDRMVMLFLGLCREAGIPVRDVPRDRKMQLASSPRKVTVRVRPSHAPTSRDAHDQARPAATTSPEVLFGFTQEDVANLSEADFNEVWSALGKVARARAKAEQTKAVASAEDAEEEVDIES